MVVHKWTCAAVALLALVGCDNAGPASPKSDIARTENAPSKAGALEPASTADSLDAAELQQLSTSVSAPAARSSQAFSAADKRTVRYLPTEQRLLRQDGIALESVMPLLASPHFDRSVDALARESASDAEAQQLSRLYSEEARKSLDGAGQFVGLSCGLSVCMGAVRMSSKDAVAQWSSSFADRKSAPSYSFVSDIRQLGANEFESRFVFSTDPGANSLTGVVKPGRK